MHVFYAFRDLLQLTMNNEIDDEEIRDSLFFITQQSRHKQLRLKRNKFFQRKTLL